MDREPRTKQTNVDLSKPLNLADFVDSDDCIGKLYDPSNNSCAICHDSHICATIYHHTTLKEKRAATKGDKVYLDEVDFERVPVDKIYELIAGSPGYWTTVMLVEAVKKYSGAADDILPAHFTKLFMAHNGIIEKEGLLYVED